MIVGKIVGNVVCTQKDPSLVGRKMLGVQPVELDSLSSTGSLFVALDCVGAGENELVLIVGGSSARMADGMDKTPVDRSIVGIIDSIEISGETVFTKWG